jgi:malto-oligosyltrehalose trehalohydrolase
VRDSPVLYRMPFGAELGPEGVRFRLWAPRHARLGLRLERGGDVETVYMQPQPGGWHEYFARGVAAGACYRFVLPEGTAVPDPAARFQPRDVYGPSEVIDPLGYGWHDQAWRGRPWSEAILYELHVGTFTPAGTFRAATDRLDYLARLGVTALELMPLADFPGRRNWGYDGVLPFAPDSSYGRPEELKALIDAAHAAGLMVLIDVIYNHFGPEGNYLSLYAPQFFNPRHETPWGAAINFDAEGSATVREFFIHNALYWLREFHFDGLRLDAAHAIADDSPVHILEELAQRVRAETLPQRVHLVLENEHNETRWLARTADARPMLYDAQWNDDVHHVLHVSATAEAEGYYADYRGDTDKLGRALAQGFAFQGELMPYRGSPRGERSDHLPPCAFVAFIQNHDQVGNRAFGERLSTLAPPAALRAVTALYLLLPQVPMLFMGEEWQCTRPFLFFCDFGADFAAAVCNGRREEFARFAAFRDPATRALIPDPQAERTFLDSKLDWERLAEPASARAFHWYQDLLTVRRRHIVPLMPQLAAAGDYQIIAPGALLLRWRARTGSELTLAVNLRTEATAGFPDAPGRLLWQQGQRREPGTLAPWSVRCQLATAPAPRAAAKLTENPALTRPVP